MIRLRQFVLALFLGMTMLIVAACSSNADGDIIGQWSAYDKDGNDCPDTIQLYDDEDNTFDMTYSEESNVTGTYNDLEQNNNYKLAFNDQKQVFKIVRDEDTLTVSDSDGNNTCTYKQGGPDEDKERSEDNTQNNENEENEDNTSENNNEENASTDENEDEDTLSSEYKAYRSSVDPVDDAGDAGIWFEGESTLKGEQITVYGQTNLLPGSQLHVNPTGKQSSIMGGWSTVTVQDDGTFYAENDLPSDFDDQVLQAITFTPQDQDDEDIKDHYQPETEEVQGPFSYLETNVDDELTKTAKVELAFPKDQSEATIDITTPDWNKPDDYGDTDVWLEADVDTDDEYVYIKGESNLLEGTKVYTALDLPGKISIGYNDSNRTHPDGTFEAKITNPEKEGVEDYDVELTIKPDEYSWPNVIETYGENGEKFEGSLIEKKQDRTQIKKQIKVQK